MGDFESVRRIAALEAEVERLRTVGETPRWVDWTPTVTQSGSVSVTVSYAKYVAIGETIHLRVLLTVTGSGSAGNAIEVSAPSGMEPAYGGGIIGAGLINDSGTAQYLGVIVWNGSVMRVRSDAAGYIGVNPSFALASSDTISLVATYEK